MNINVVLQSIDLHDDTPLVIRSLRHLADLIERVGLENFYGTSGGAGKYQLTDGNPSTIGETWASE